MKSSHPFKVRTGLGQDSHRFHPQDNPTPLVIGGIIIPDHPGFHANSDGDVVLHAICNAISSLTGILILGGIADDLCLKDGITDSEVYLIEAMKTLGNKEITHVAISIEALRPKLKKHLNDMKVNIARIMNLDPSDIGITATSGEGLTNFGCGDGIQALALVTTVEAG